jgi:hypothetical protein
MKSYAERSKSRAEIIKTDRDAGIAITQDRINRLTSALELDAVELDPNGPPGENENANGADPALDKEGT